MSATTDARFDASDCGDGSAEGCQTCVDCITLIEQRPAHDAVRLDSMNRAPAPFVWQHGTRLLLLDDDPQGWIMAELSFQADLCRYVEVRRAVYALTREAIGAVISRALASGAHAAVDTALSLHEWLSTYYGIAVISDVIARPDAGPLEFTA